MESGEHVQRECLRVWLRQLSFALSEEEMCPASQLFKSYLLYSSGSIPQGCVPHNFSSQVGLALKEEFGLALRKKGSLYNVASSECSLCNNHVLKELKQSKSEKKNFCLRNQPKERNSCTNVEGDEHESKIDNSSSKDWHENSSLRHLNEFVASLSCAPELLSLRLFPDAKELTESMGVFHAIRSRIPSLSTRDENVTCVVVGDGSSPRTAAMIAFRTNWLCHSIDPQLRLSLWEEKGIKNLIMHACRVEDVAGEILSKHSFPSHLVVLLVHAHVSVDDSMQAILYVGAGENRFMTDSEIKDSIEGKSQYDETSLIKKKTTTTN